MPTCSSQAVSFCPEGAIERIAVFGSSDYVAAVRALSNVIGPRGIVLFSDDPATTHAMILDAFDAAIEEAKSS